MSKTSTPTVLLALESFVCEVNGERLPFTKGDPIEADHPAVKANPHLFGPLAFRHPIVERKVEQATAAPGEKRYLGPRPAIAAEAKVRPATPAEEKGIAATVAAESKPTEGKPMRVSDLHGKT